jgi:hypothetical protein
MHPIENHNLNVKFHVEHVLKEMDMVMTTKRLQCLGISLVSYDPVNVDVEFTRHLYIFPGKPWVFHLFVSLP